MREYATGNRVQKVSYDDYKSNHRAKEAEEKNEANKPQAFATQKKKREVLVRFCINSGCTKCQIVKGEESDNRGDCEEDCSENDASLLKSKGCAGRR